MTLKIEVVIVCKNYSDFLSHTLPENIELVDRMVVVTSADDKGTQRLCAEYGVDCLETAIYQENGDAFNKGRMINLGLGHLRHDGWILHIDADILLPHKFKHMLMQAKLNTEFIYGADRQNTLSYDNFQEHRNKSIPEHKWRFMVQPNKEFPLGSRLVHQSHGYCPIGYFQLWHSSKRKSYPEICGSAEHSDCLFAIQWPRDRRALLPEFFVTHLESEITPMGINWKGRKTKHFGHHCHPHCRKHHHHHHHPWPPKPYCR